MRRFRSKPDKPNKRRTGPLSTDQMAQWERGGFLVLAGFFDDAELLAFEAEIDRYWNDRSASNPIVVDMIDGELKDQRLHMRDLDPEHRHTPHKVNDLYLDSEVCRSLVLHERLVSRLAQLLGDEPVATNSLNFGKGSQQDHHFDTYFMPPATVNQLIVTSICFEDVHPEAGPLTYYPGSHAIAPYRFPDGGLAVLGHDFAPAKAYIDAELTKRRLEPETFLGKRGDVFIWHAQLYHGGQVIVDHDRTRQSLVTHYHGRATIAANVRAVAAGGGSWLDRPHQAVVGET